MQLPHFCYHCRSLLPQIKDAFVLDHHSGKVFCSEPCILQFHRPYLDFFTQQEHERRSQLGLLDEPFKLNDQQQYDLVGQVVSAPDRKSILKDELGMEFAVLIKQSQGSHGVPQLTALVIAHLFKGKPSFIFHHLFTASEALVLQYAPASTASSDPITAPVTGLATADFEQDLAGLKQYLWQELIRLQKLGMAIPVFNSPNHEEFKLETLEHPQEVYQFFHRPSLQSVVFINDVSGGEDIFYSFVLCYQGSAAQGKSNAASTWIPLYSFVSKDPELYYFFKQGACLTRRSVN